MPNRLRISHCVLLVAVSAAVSATVFYLVGSVVGREAALQDERNRDRRAADNASARIAQLEGEVEHHQSLSVMRERGLVEAHAASSARVHRLVSALQAKREKLTALEETNAGLSAENRRLKTEVKTLSARLKQANRREAVLKALMLGMGEGTVYSIVTSVHVIKSDWLPHDISSVGRIALVQMSEQEFIEKFRGKGIGDRTNAVVISCEEQVDHETERPVFDVRVTYRDVAYDRSDPSDSRAHRSSYTFRFPLVDGMVDTGRWERFGMIE